MFHINNMTQMSCNFREQSKIVRMGGKMSQTKPPPWRHSTAGQLFRQVFSADLPRGGARSARIFCRFFLPLKMAKTGERAGCFAFWYILRMGWWIPAKFGTKMANAIFFISYFDKICLTPTGNLWLALGFLYSEARLYKGARLAGLSQSATTRSTGNISVGVKKVSHSNTRGIVSSLFLSRLNTAAQ